jgi:hypothetical protein
LWLVGFLLYVVMVAVVIHVFFWFEMSLFVIQTYTPGKGVFFATEGTENTAVIHCCEIDYGDFNHEILVTGYAAKQSEEKHENNPCWHPWCLIFKEQLIQFALNANLVYL